MPEKHLEHQPDQLTLELGTEEVIDNFFTVVEFG
jgi:hypothetical protein